MHKRDIASSWALLLQLAQLFLETVCYWMEVQANLWNVIDPQTLENSHYCTSKDIQNTRVFTFWIEEVGQEVREGKKSFICLLWGENHQQITTDGQTQTCIAQDADFLWPKVQSQGRTAVLCTAGSHPVEPLPLLPFPSRLWLSFILMLTKPDSYRFLRLLFVPLLSYCLHPIVRSLPKANL